MHVLVVSDNIANLVVQRLRDILCTNVHDQLPAVVSFEEVERRVRQKCPEMLVVVLSPDPERGLQALRQVRDAARCPVLAVGLASEPKLILRALQEGADHYLDEADLETAFEGVMARLQDKKKEKHAGPAGELIAVLGASGGSGASTLSVNLAAVLAKDHGSCALLDLKPGRGDLAALLDLNPRFHLADVCLNVARLDQAMFEKALVRHASGVCLLASPQAYGDTRLVTCEGVGLALGLARRLFAHAVVDLEDCFHQEQVLALRQASVILLAARLDFTSLRNVRRILEHLSGLGINRARVRLVVNRHGQANELPAAEAEDALGGKAAWYIPDDPRTINGANNMGIPAVLKSPEAKVSQAIAQLARDTLEPLKEKTSLLSKLFALWTDGASTVVTAGKATAHP